MRREFGWCDSDRRKRLCPNVPATRLRSFSSRKFWWMNFARRFCCYAFGLYQHSTAACALILQSNAIPSKNYRQSTASACHRMAYQKEKEWEIREWVPRKLPLAELRFTTKRTTNEWNGIRKKKWINFVNESLKLSHVSTSTHTFAFSGSCRSTLDKIGRIRIGEWNSDK